MVFDYKRYRFEKHEQVRELVKNNHNLFDINIFQETQGSTLVWLHFATILFNGLKNCS